MYTLLIVEDTVAIREEICDILIMEGFTVFQAENGKIGFEIALKENPDLIISDILMPELDGFMMFEKLQNFFSTMPRLRHNIEIENPVTGIVSEVTLEGLGDFLN